VSDLIGAHHALDRHAAHDELAHVGDCGGRRLGIRRGLPATDHLDEQPDDAFGGRPRLAADVRAADQLGVDRIRDVLGRLVNPRRVGGKARDLVARRRSDGTRVVICTSLSNLSNVDKLACGVSTV